MSKSGPGSKDPDPGLDLAQYGTKQDQERIGPFRTYSNHALQMRKTKPPTVCYRRKKYIQFQNLNATD
jgi:hypothetical protein